MWQAPTSFAALPAPSEIHQDAAHEVGRKTEEVRTVLPLDAIHVMELQKRLVDQGGGVEISIAPLPCQGPVGDPSELAVHERHELL